MTYKRKPMVELRRVEASLLSVLVSVRSEIERLSENDKYDASASITPIMNIADDANVRDLKLSPRALNCLEFNGINTVSELTGKSEMSLLKSKNFGRKSLNEIIFVLSLHGRSLKGRWD